MNLTKIKENNEILRELQTTKNFIMQNFSSYGEAEVSRVNRALETLEAITIELTNANISAICE